MLSLQESCATGLAEVKEMERATALYDGREAGDGEGTPEQRPEAPLEIFEIRAFDELDDDWDAVTFDDLYTPGSYWVNPPSPRTVDGRHADPWTGEVVEYDMSGAVVSAAEAEDESFDDGELSAAERAILADIEGL